MHLGEGWVNIQEYNISAIMASIYLSNGINILRSLLYRQLIPGLNGIIFSKRDFNLILFVIEYDAHYGNNITIETETDRIPGFERYGVILSQSHKQHFEEDIGEKQFLSKKVRTQRLQLEHIKKVNELKY